MTSDTGNLERLLGEVGRGSRALVGEATRALVRRFGDRGSCVLVDDRARVVLSTEVPGLSDLHIDLARYPEIASALTSHEIVSIAREATRRVFVVDGQHRAAFHMGTGAECQSP